LPELHLAVRGGEPDRHLLLGLRGGQRAVPGPLSPGGAAPARPVRAGGPARRRGGVAMSVRKAIVIAAGRGRRLMPYTDQMPKCLVPVDGRSILQIQLEALRAHGVEEVVIIRGYLGEVLEARCAELGDGVRFVDNREWEHNNVLESLFTAEHEIDGPVLLSYSDIIYTREVVGALVAAPGD